MKRVFGQEILNNVSKEIEEMMENQEKQIKMRLEKRTMKMLNSFYGESPISRSRSKAINPKKNPLKQNKNKLVVNPMITILFVGMVFKSWKRYCEHKEKGELDSDGSVIRVAVSESDESESESDSSESSENVDEINESNNSNSDSDSSGSEISNSNLSNSEEEGSKGSGDIKENVNGDVVMNVIGKFIKKKNHAEGQNRIEGFERRPRTNMFRTFFAANQNTSELKEN